ncbi:MAG: hypothetical protein DME05_02980 [Candidatus Rokuibacteriota bacterium]|nr:MAG: hypothetical protein DME05_02980 [Candidatus Rokubacteria bacterium]PYN76901.1 MAG: hypothetical protein DMD97_10390 [Candidatus Rokubacteria bacterium]
MSRRQSLRLVSERCHDEASSSNEAARAQAQDEAGVDKRPPPPRKPADVVEDDEIFDDLDE